MSLQKSNSSFNAKTLEDHKELKTFLHQQEETTTAGVENSASSTKREFYRNQASAVNQELLSKAEETFDILQGTESLVLAEFETWKKRFFDALGNATKATSTLASQYSVPQELLQFTRENYPSVDELLMNNNNTNGGGDMVTTTTLNENSNKNSGGELSINDQEIRKIFEVNNNMDKDDAFFPRFLNDDSEEQEKKEEEHEQRSSSSQVVSTDNQAAFDRAPLEFQLQNTRQFEEFSSLLRELRINSRSSSASSRTSQSRLLEIADKLNTASKQLLPLTLDKFNPVPAIIDMAKALQSDPLSTTKMELSRLQQLVEEHSSTLETKMRDRNGSAVAEHYVLIEDINEEISHCYREMMKSHYEGYKSVELAYEDVDQFQHTVNEVENSMGNLDAALNQQELLVEGAESDASILERQVEVRTIRRETEMNEFSKETERHLDDLETLHQRHSSVWSEVLAKLNELNSINEKIGLTKNSVASLVTKNAAMEAKHLREMQCLSRLISMRRCVAASAKKGVETLNTTRQFASDMLLLIAKKEPETIRQKLSLEQCVKYYDSYAAFVSHLQDCAGKKEQRLENSKRLKRSVNFQVEVAGQTFDPLVSKYKEQLLGLNDLIESIESESKKIQDELQEGEYRKLWTESIEPELLNAKIPYEEPAQRAQHQRLEMLQRQFAAVDAFHREEQGKLDEERRVVRVMKNLVHQQQLTTTSHHGQNNQNTSGASSPGINNTNVSPLRSPISPIEQQQNQQNNSTTIMTSERRAVLHQRSNLFSPQSNVNK